MKIRKLNILLALSFGAIIALSGCSKDDGAIPERVTINAVPTITTNIDPTGSKAIDLTNLASFAGKFKIDNYLLMASPFIPGTPGMPGLPFMPGSPGWPGSPSAPKG